MTAEKTNRICFPLFIVSTILTVILALIKIWLPLESDFLNKLFLTSAVFVVASGLTMSVTRALNGAHSTRTKYDRHSPDTLETS